MLMLVVPLRVTSPVKSILTVTFPPVAPPPFPPPPFPPPPFPPPPFPPLNGFEPLPEPPPPHAPSTSTAPTATIATRPRLALPVSTFLPFAWPPLLPSRSRPSLGDGAKGVPKPEAYM